MSEDNSKHGLDHADFGDDSDRDALTTNFDEEVSDYE